eukprot:403364784
MKIGCVLALKIKIIESGRVREQGINDGMNDLQQKQGTVILRKLEQKYKEICQLELQSV